MTQLSEDPGIDQWTTKERAPYPFHLVRFVLGHYHNYENMDLPKLRREIEKYRRELKREPEARQIEIVFPLQLNLNQNEVLKKRWKKTRP